MERAKGSAWILFSIALIGLGLLTAIFAVDLGMLPQWPSVYMESLASLLAADYSAEPLDVAYLAPIGEGFIEDLLAEEAVNAVYLSDAPPVFGSGPVVNVPELTPPAPGSTPPGSTSQPPGPSSPSQTPRSPGTLTPDPSQTPLPTPTPTLGPGETPVATETPTPTGTPLTSPPPTTPSPTTVGPTDTPHPSDTPTPTSPPPPTDTPPPPTNPPPPPPTIPPPPTNTPIPPPTPIPPDVVVITRANYQSVKNELDLCATSDGGYDPGVTLTASPGGVMTRQGDTYHIRFTLPGQCPCTVTVTSSRGGSATVTVGP